MQPPSLGKGHWAVPWGAQVPVTLAEDPVWTGGPAGGQMRFFWFFCIL